MGWCQTPSRITTSLTPAQNASLFVFKVYTRASMQMIYQLQTEPKNYLSEEQRSISPPVHLVHFSFSINKCFDRHSAAACFLSLIRRERERGRESTYESWRMMCYKALKALQLMYISWGIRCRIIHDALLCCCVWETESLTMDSWHGGGALEYIWSTKAHSHLLFPTGIHS